MCCVPERKRVRKHEKTERESREDGGTWREDGRGLLMSHCVSGETNTHTHTVILLLGSWEEGVSHQRQISTVVNTDVAVCLSHTHTPASQNSTRSSQRLKHVFLSEYLATHMWNVIWTDWGYWVFNISSHLLPKRQSGGNCRGSLSALIIKLWRDL